MSYGDHGYARTRFGGSGFLTLPPPNEVLPPPIPGGSGAYYWSNENGMYPWAYGGWAGARPALAFEAGGIVAIPHQDRGVVEVMAWWPDAPVIQIYRVHPDGSRYPVRGAYGRQVAELTRHNFAQNPSVEIGLNGYVPDAGSPTLTQITTATVSDIPAGDYALRATIASSGSNGVAVPTSLTGALPVTIGFDAHFVVRPDDLSVLVSWTDSGGSPLATNTVTLTDDEVNNAVGQFARMVVTMTPPVGAVTPTVKIIADGMPSASVMDLDGITVEQGITSGSRFDGDSLGGFWDDTAGLSSSRLSPVQTIVDGEAPLDVPLSYIVSNPQITGGQAQSGVISLLSNGRWCWLTHPLSSGEPVRADLRSVPILEHGVEQGVFYPIRAALAVVVSSPRREPATEITFNAYSFAERDTLLALFSDGLPVLLRAPARYGYGEGTWWSLGSIIEDREERHAFQDAMVLTAPAVTVSPPRPELVFAT